MYISRQKGKPEQQWLYVLSMPGLAHNKRSKDLGALDTCSEYDSGNFLQTYMKNSGDKVLYNEASIGTHISAFFDFLKGYCLT